MGKINIFFEKIAGEYVYIDTNVFIYFLDKTPPYFPVVSAIFQAIEVGKFIGITGDISLAETLVKPYQTKNILLATHIKSFFLAEDFLLVKSHDLETFDLCSQIRAEYKMKFADALHYATAIKSGCKFFITNDIRVHSTDSIEVILIKDILD